MLETVISKPIEETHPYLASIIEEMANGRSDLVIQGDQIYRKGNGGPQCSGLQLVKTKVKPNEPCLCGATKSDGTPIKYKKCCG